MSALYSMHKQVPSVLARAIVRSNQDPNNLGRVKVQYPSFHGSSSEMPSEWARLALPYASKESGMWFLPEVGDEVIVLLEDGDLNTPIIIGCLYSDDRKPPTTGRNGDLNQNNENNLRYIKTRSGHLVCFDDSADNKSISIKDASGNLVTMEDKAVTIQHKSGSTIALDSKAVTLKNNSGSEIQLSAGKVTIKSAGTIELGEQAAMSLIKGEAFQLLFNTHIHVTAWGPSTPPIMPMTVSELNPLVKV